MWMCDVCPFLEARAADPSPAQNAPDAALCGCLQVMLWSTAAKMSMAVELGQVFGPEEGVGSVHWLSASALLLGDTLNRQLQLHSMAPGGEGAELRQTLQLESRDGATGLCNAIAVQPQAGLAVLANMERKAVYVLHVRLSEDGGASFDYLTKYQLGWPILSMAAEHSSDGASSGVAKLYCVQTHAIQAYALQLAECVPAPSSAAAAEVSRRQGGQEGRSAAPASRPDVMPTHALADSEEEESRPGSARSAGRAELARPGCVAAAPAAARDDAAGRGGAAAAAADAEAADQAGRQPQRVAGVRGWRGCSSCPGRCPGRPASAVQQPGLWAAASAHASGQASKPGLVRRQGGQWARAPVRWDHCRRAARGRVSGARDAQPLHQRRSTSAHEDSEAQEGWRGSSAG